MKKLSILTLAFFWLGFAGLVTLGCGKSGKDDQQKKAADEKNQPVKGPETVKPPVTDPGAKPAEPAKADPAPVTPAPIPEAKIVVENAGEGEKIALRYEYTAGVVTTAVMEMKMGMQMTMGAMQQPMTNLPMMKMSMKLTNREVKTSGNLVYDFILDSVDVVPEADTPPAVVDSMRTALKDIMGMNGNAEVTGRGITTSADMRMPKNTNPQLAGMMDSMKQQMSQMSVPLPEEPVGQGASWTVTTQLTTGGMLVTNQYKYTLAKVEGKVIEMKVALLQTAEPQELKNPQLPPDVKLKLQEFKSSGNGTVKMDLTKMVPTSEITSETQMKMAVEKGAETQTMEQKMNLSLKLYPEQK
jgi:hypothetical protein